MNTIKSKVLHTPEAILEALRSAPHPAKQSLKGFYDSRIDGIILDPDFMSVPIDDHLVHRGHSVFDTLTVVNGKTFMLDRHLKRFVSSAQSARLGLPKPIEEIKQILKNLVASTHQRNCKVRYWLTAGPGSMAVWPVGNMESFYALLYEADPMQGFTTDAREYTVDIPLKPRFLATMKSTNYLLNALSSMESRDKGGLLGIQHDEQGYITESAVANVAFVMPDGKFITPTFEKILNGVTIERVLVYAEELVQQGVLTSVEQRSIHISEAKNSIEMMLTGGDTVRAIVEWDGIAVGTGSMGQVVSYFQTRLKEELQGSKEELVEEIDYTEY
jgi:4-amino-4-deoxychorismate lyase